MRNLLVAAALATGGAFIFVAPAVAAPDGDTLVSVGGSSTSFASNRQNEPAIAVDANHPNILAAGANDNIDIEPCSAGDPTDCPFTTGVGAVGVYFSFDSGNTWTRPTYTGLTARGCMGPAACTPVPGPIGTIPWYYESGLSSYGDPGLAFGPRRGADGRFSWANGSRLYFSTMALGRNGLDGPWFLTVSRVDDVVGAASGNKDAWLRPVVLSKRNPIALNDKGQIWADNAASSPYFGNVYTCWGVYRSNSRGQALPEPLIVATSSDGGDTWTEKQVSAASNTPFNSRQGWGRTGCTIRTDSHGVVYVFVEQYGPAATSNVNQHVLIKSVDGGSTWRRPVKLFNVTDGYTEGQIDPDGWAKMDGVAGARATGEAPSVDIANGAPTGADATNLMVDAYADAVDGLNHEHVVVRTSTNGTDWSSPSNVETLGDRGHYAAVALSPNGTDLYVVYSGLTTSYQYTTFTPRGMVAVVLHAEIGPTGLNGWSVLHRSVESDPRASSWFDLKAEFLGDYIYAVATRTYGAAVWTDDRNATVCDAINAYRQAAHDGLPASPPDVQLECLEGFGNSDIYGGSYLDPSP